MVNQEPTLANVEATNQVVEVGEESLPIEPIVDEYTDPGQLEGISAAPIKAPNTHAPPEESKKWNKIYAQAKEGERQNEALKKQLEEQNKINIAMQEHNKKLEESFDVKFEAVKTQTTKETSQNKQLKLGELKRERSKAYEEGESAKVAEITDQIEDLRFDLLSSQIPKNEFNEQAFLAKIKAESVQEDFNRAAGDFISKSPWFQPESQDYDAVMYAAADGLEQQLRAQYPDPHSRMQEVKKQVEERFNYKGKGVSSQPANLFVERSAPASRNNNGQVTLSSDEKRVAQNLFPDKSPVDAEKTYAQQVQRIKEGK